MRQRVDVIVVLRLRYPLAMTVHSDAPRTAMERYAGRAMVARASSVRMSHHAHAVPMTAITAAAR